MGTVSRNSNEVFYNFPKHTRNSIIKGLLSQVASLVRSVKDLVVEDREVEGEAEADGMRRGEISLSNLRSVLVRLEGLVGGFLALISNSELGEVAVVVTLPVPAVRCRTIQKPCGDGISHLVIENLGLARLGRRDQVLVQNLQDVLADLGQFGLNLLAVLLDQGDLSVISLRLLLLLDRGDNPPRSTASTNNVLVGNRQEIALLNGEFLVGRGDDLHVLDHLYRSRQQPACAS